jgi:hypothetical protein
MKRVITATLLGLLFGLGCNFLACSNGEMPLPVTIQIILSRTLMGFAIGISTLKLGHWSLHGIIFGISFSLPLAFSGLMAPENPEFSNIMIFVSTLVAGLIYGLLIELITTVGFKAKQ